MVHSSRNGILVVDSEGKKVLLNRRMAELWDMPADLAADVDHQRRLEWMTLQTRDPQQFIERVRYLYAHPDEISSDEFELVNGRILDRYSAPVRDEDGKHFGRIWSYQDIYRSRTRRGSDRRAGRFSRQGAGRNPGARSRGVKFSFGIAGPERIYGWSREEATGRNIGGLLYADIDKFKEANRRAIDRGEWHGELVHLTKDGRQLTVEARWDPHPGQ